MEDVSSQGIPNTGNQLYLIKAKEGDLIHDYYLYVHGRGRITFNSSIDGVELTRKYHIPVKEWPIKSGRSLPAFFHKKNRVTYPGKVIGITKCERRTTA